MPSLSNTISTLLASGVDNPALALLVSDYRKFHLVFLVVAGLFLLGLGLFSLFCWRRFARAGGRPFERRTYLWFGLLGTAAVLFLAVVYAANVSVVLDPRPGFTSAVGLIGSPPAGTRSADLHAAFATWLRSGHREMPAPVARAVDDRLAWQRPKAIVSSALLVLLAGLSALVWRTLIRRSRVPGRGRSVALLLAGVASVPVGLVLMAMVIGNVEYSVAPVAVTLFYG